MSCQDCIDMMENPHGEVTLCAKHALTDKLAEALRARHSCLCMFHDIPWSHSPACLNATAVLKEYDAAKEKP